MKLRGKTLIPLLVLFVASISSVVGVIVYQQSKVLREDVIELSRQIARTESQKMATLLDKAYYVGDSLSHSFEEFAKLDGDAKREFALRSLKGALASNREFVGTWACFEPNAFDGRDGEYRNVAPFTGQGRFASYWYRTGDSLASMALEEYQTADWYAMAKEQGKPVLMEPFSYEIEGKEVLMTTLSMPITVNGSVIGVAGIDVPLNSFQKLVEGITPFETGYAFVVSNSAQVIAHPTKEIIQTDGSQYFQNPAEFESSVENGEIYMETKKAAGGQKSDSVFITVPLHIGELEKSWGFGVSSPLTKVNEQRNALVRIGVIIGAIFVVLVGIIIFILIRAITVPITGITKGALNLAAGDIGLEDLSEEEQKKIASRKDELGEIGNAFDKLIEYQKEKVALAQEIADKNLQVDVSVSSEKDTLGDAFQKMVESLNEMLLNVSGSVEQVSTGSDQVAQASQTLSQGATEQASSMEEISSSLTEISSQSQQNTKNAEEANALANQASTNAKGGKEQMQELIDAMAKITSSSDEINKIVKTIDDISFQINLLALNANVEAARAGKYGKGFAVVAEEVRNLASRSGEAVQETSRSVEAANGNIQIGSDLVGKTSKQLEDIAEGADKVAQFLDEITQASREQTQGIEQITAGLDQIDQVTQSNTASAEESASSAEELASQAQQLKAMVAEFKLNNGSHGTRLLE